MTHPQDPARIAAGLTEAQTEFLRFMCGDSERDEWDGLEEMTFAKNAGLLEIRRSRSLKFPELTPLGLAVAEQLRKEGWGG